MSAARPALAALALALACNSAPPPQAAQAQPEADAKSGGGLGKWFGRKDPVWTFDFKDPGPGPRAPVTSAFFAEIGLSKPADAEAIGQRLGLRCGDTSIRAMMEDRRQAERKRIEEAKARGEDAVTAASWLNHKSKREANPQVRYSCPQTDSAQLTDRTRPTSRGRLLYVFDSPEHPLRHASYQRTFTDAAAALTDYQDAVAHYTKVYGAPTKTPTRELPAPDGSGKLEFPTAINFETSWEFADLLVKVGILRYADLITVGERVEVPHGIRPDAPRDGKPPVASHSLPPAPAGTPPTPAAAPDAPAPAAPAPADSAPTPAAVAGKAP